MNTSLQTLTPTANPYGLGLTITAARPRPSPALIRAVSMRETVSATVTSAESEDNTIYIATAEFDGETYTDVKGSYYIRILGSEHGTVTADKTHADEGEAVTLTATPDDKYMLKSITVKDADNNAVTVTNNSS